MKKSQKIMVQKSPEEFIWHRCEGSPSIDTSSHQFRFNEATLTKCSWKAGRSNKMGDRDEWLIDIALTLADSDPSDDALLQRAEEFGPLELFGTNSQLSKAGQSNRQFAPESGQSDEERARHLHDEYCSDLADTERVELWIETCKSLRFVRDCWSLLTLGLEDKDFDEHFNALREVYPFQFPHPCSEHTKKLPISLTPESDECQVLWHWISTVVLHNIPNVGFKLVAPAMSGSRGKTVARLDPNTLREALWVELWTAIATGGLLKKCQCGKWFTKMGAQKRGANARHCNDYCRKKSSDQKCRPRGARQ